MKCFNDQRNCKSAENDYTCFNLITCESSCDGLILSEWEKVKFINYYMSDFKLTDKNK